MRDEGRKSPNTPTPVRIKGPLNDIFLKGKGRGREGREGEGKGRKGGGKEGTGRESQNVNKKLNKLFMNNTSMINGPTSMLPLLMFPKNGSFLDIRSPRRLIVTNFLV